MVERRVKLQIPGGAAHDAVEVPITESTERWSEYTLEDGTVLRAKLVVLSFMRLEGQYDQEGNPAYAMKSSQALTTVSVPEALRKKVQ